MSGFFHGTPPRVLAHRGFCGAGDGDDVVPENTLAAFARAVRLGVTHVETDVRATADGVAVLSHDPDLRRLLGRPDQIRQLTFAQLQGMDLGGGHTVPSLSEVLAAFPQLNLNIDIESRDAIAPTVAAILDSAATNRVLVTSFSEIRRAAAVRRLPGVATSASAPMFALALLCAKLGLISLVRLVLRHVDAVQVPQSTLGMTILTPRVVRALRRAKVEIHVWTVDDVDDMNLLLDLGVDGIITDRADIACAVVATRV